MLEINYSDVNSNIWAIYCRRNEQLIIDEEDTVAKTLGQIMCIHVLAEELCMNVAFSKQNKNSAK